MIAGKFRPAAHTSRPAGLSAESFMRFFQARPHPAQRAPCANHERTVKPLSCRAGESLCRRGQRILMPSANHERTVKPLSCRAGELLCRRAQRILTPCANHERTVKPLSCRAGESLLPPRPAHHPAAPSNSALCAEMCIAMARASAGRSACRRRQSAPSMKRVCSARCRRWSS